MRSRKSPAPTPKTNSPHSHSQADNQDLPTFLDHIYELRRRLFWVVATILVASSVAYAFLGTILDVLMRPLGDERLFYLTPGGGLTFSFKLSAYVGILVAVPIIMYHLYRYLEPLMNSLKRPAIFYVGFSSALAAAGVLFAYFVCLPAAIRFLTGFNIDHIQAMLTADSYLSFVTTYLLAAAILFQIPLLLMIINTMTPLKPSGLMKLQKFVILGAFIVAAIISPTPDIMNQLFLAVPIITMYQIGIILVWMQNRMRARKQRRQTLHHTQSRASKPAVAQPAPQAPLHPPMAPIPAAAAAVKPQSPSITVRPARQYVAASQRRRVYSDIVAPARNHGSAIRSRNPRTTPKPTSISPAAHTKTTRARSIDGFISYRPANASGTS